MSENKPLVSCIMPTWNRAAFISAAIDCFLKQTYPHKELIVLDDGPEPAKPELSSDWPVRYFIWHRMKIGDKRNKCCELAKGDIICHFDDDDWSDPNRIERQVNTLKESGKPVTGYSSIYYWDVVHKRASIFKAAVYGYVCGGSLCYLKSWWEGNRFPSVQSREDNPVVYANLVNISPIEAPEMYVARAHDSNTGGDKSHTGSPADSALLPTGFWENEKLRLSWKQA